MRPDEHAVISGFVVFIAAQLAGFDTPDVLLWTVAGTAAGVLIDVDHALLSMVVKGRVREGLYWFRHPVKAMTDPDAFLADMEYPALVYHRMATHLAILVVIILLTGIHPLVIPVMIGVAAHVVADIVWDVHTGEIP